MDGREMPSEHLAAPAAFEADNIIAVTRSPDLHRGCSLFVEFGCRFAEVADDLMHCRD
jgi:DNA topoisomerase VI subunit B